MWCIVLLLERLVYQVGEVIGVLPLEHYDLYYEDVAVISLTKWVEKSITICCEGEAEYTLAFLAKQAPPLVARQAPQLVSSLSPRRHQTHLSSQLYPLVLVQEVSQVLNQKT